MSVLITGGSGLLGSNWAKKISKSNPVFIGIHHQAFQNNNCIALSLDLNSEDALVGQINKNEITTVINTIAITNIEYCERNPQYALMVNAQFAKNLARACERSGAKIVHISTDQLYSGKAGMLSEDVAPEPVNVYGLTKAKSEKYVAEANADALIVRTNFYGWGTAYRRSFSDWIFDEIKLGKKPSLFADVFYTPIYLGDLISLVEALLKVDASGIYNVVGSDRVSKFDFGIALLSKMDMDINLIEPISIAGRQDLVSRPRDMSLLNEKLLNKIGCQPLYLTDGLDNFLKDYNK